MMYLPAMPQSHIHADMHSGEYKYCESIGHKIILD